MSEKIHFGLDIKAMTLAKILFNHRIALIYFQIYRTEIGFSVLNYKGFSKEGPFKEPSEQALAFKTKNFDTHSNDFYML